MCIDLLRFGDRLDVPLLLEQIWFQVVGEDCHLEVTEVYDVLLRNPRGCQPLSEVWALFPHSFYKEGKYDIEAVSVKPTDYADTRYDWFFRGPPSTTTLQRLKKS